MVEQSVVGFPALAPLLQGPIEHKPKRSHDRRGQNAHRKSVLADDVQSPLGRARHRPVAVHQPVAGTEQRRRAAPQTVPQLGYRRRGVDTYRFYFALRVRSCLSHSRSSLSVSRVRARGRSFVTPSPGWMNAFQATNAIINGTTKPTIQPTNGAPNIAPTQLKSQITPVQAQIVSSSPAARAMPAPMAADLMSPAASPRFSLTSNLA